MIVWDVSPEIGSFGFITLRYYSLAFIIAFLSGYYILRWVMRVEDRPERHVDDLFILVFAGTIIGARLGHCFFYDPGYYLSNPVEILKVWQGGLASHGAAMGILGALYIFSRWREEFYLWTLDRVVIVIALAAILIRLGNLFNSEIYGTATDVPWAFIFVRVDDIPRHPTQLYEAAAYSGVFLYLLQTYRRFRRELPPGRIFGWFLVGIFGARFFIEFWKADQSAFEAGWLLNMGQLLSLPFVVIGLNMAIQSRNRKPEAGPKRKRAGRGSKRPRK